MGKFFCTIASAFLVAAPALAEDAAIEIVSGPGVSVSRPTVTSGESVLEVSGAVCRNAFSAARPRFVRLQALDEQGFVLETRWSQVRASPGYRGGCSFYTIAVASSGDNRSLRLSFHKSRRQL